MHKTVAILLTMAAVLSSCGTSSVPDVSPTTPWRLLAHPSAASLRGLAAVDGRVAWAAGTRGTVLRTNDGGATWETLRVPETEALDFRDVHASDANEVWLLSAGKGDSSRIFRSEDRGLTWSENWINPHPEGFMDGFAWWTRQRGIAYGDPVGGRMFVMTTADGGKTWQRVPASGLPPARPNEAGFAASGTGIVTHGEQHVWMATGGPGVARVFRSSDSGRTWTAVDTPLADPSETSGIFSMTFVDARRGIIVGGDYKQPDRAVANAAWTKDGGQTWHPPTGSPPRGYRSGVAWRGDLAIAVGPTGTDVSRDGGRTWTRRDDTALHSVALSREAAWGTGGDGRLARIP